MGTRSWGVLHLHFIKSSRGTRWRISGDPTCSSQPTFSAPTITHLTCLEEDNVCLSPSPCPFISSYPLLAIRRAQEGQPLDTETIAKRTKRHLDELEVNSFSLRLASDLLSHSSRFTNSALTMQSHLAHTLVWTKTTRLGNLPRAELARLFRTNGSSLGQPQRGRKPI